MNIVKGLLAVVVALSTTTAFADFNGSYTRLPDCGGTANVSQTSRNVQLVFDGVKFCKTVIVNGAEYKLEENYDRTFSGKIALENRVGDNRVRVVVESGSKKHQDSFIAFYTVAPSKVGNVFLSTLAGKRFAYLPSCGGTVELDVTYGNVNLIFRNVENCSNFDILSSGGDSVDYPNKKLQEQGRGRGGSFTLPRRVLDFGLNGVQVVVKSNSGKTNDYVFVQFLAL